jgi:hypothetical protein
MKKTAILLTVIIILCGCGQAGEEYESAAKAPAPCEPAETAPAAAPHRAERPVATPAERPMAVMEKPPADLTEGLTVSPEYVDVFVEPAGKKLGAYDLVVSFNPSIVRISRVERVAEGFPGAPMVNCDTFTSGSTRIISLQAGAQVSSGRIAIARVYFSPVSPGRTGIAVDINNIYDPGSQRILGSATLSATELVVSR